MRKVTSKILGPSMSVRTVVRNIAVKMYLATSKNHLPKVSFMFPLSSVYMEFTAGYSAASSSYHLELCKTSETACKVLPLSMLLNTLP